jgi:hypothetical protein
VRGKGSRGGWRHKEGEYGFGGDSFILGFVERRFWEELGGTDLAVRIYCAEDLLCTPWLRGLGTEG